MNRRSLLVLGIALLASACGGEASQTSGAPPQATADGGLPGVTTPSQWDGGSQVLGDSSQLQPDGGPPVPQSDAGPPAADATAGPACDEHWCTVPAGTFTMGSPADDPCRGQDERPHDVTLTNDLKIGVHEVTRGEFTAVMGKENLPAIYWAFQWQTGLCDKDCYFAEDKEACSQQCPVTNVTWHQAAAYCDQLTSTEIGNQCQICVGEGAKRKCQPTDPSVCQCYDCTGSGASLRCDVKPQYKGDAIYACPGFRLPTEAEWELAYRATTSAASYAGPISECGADADDQNAHAIGWYKRNAYVNIGPNAYLALHPPKEKQPNAWGLHDMAGNVSEWCHSWYGAYPAAQAVTNPEPLDPPQAALSQRVIRGGHYDSPASSLRAAAREHAYPSQPNKHYGFRCARTAF